jgi:hypothetical protein
MAAFAPHRRTTVARYFFDTPQGGHPADTDGTELRDHAAARKYAIVFAGQVMHGEPTVLWDGRNFNVEVSDDKALLLFTLTAFVTNAPAAGDTK